MRLVNGLVTITTTVIFLQLLLDGLLTFNFINADIHIVVGIIVFILDIATLIVSILSRRDREHR